MLEIIACSLERNSKSGSHQAMETPAGVVCDVICDLVSIDVATKQL